MAQTLILAKSITEANRYARAVGLERFTYRAVRSAGSIRGVRHAEAHLLSSFLERPDRHAIMGALRWAKTLEVFYVDFRDGEIRDGDEVVVNGPTERELEVAYRYNTLRDDSNGDNMIAEGGPATPEEDSAQTAPPESSEDPASAAPRRRRSRCGDCGELHFKDEPCPVKSTPAGDPFADFF